MIPVIPENAFCDSPDEGAALGLLGLMTGISEDCWCAGWLTGLEHSLWQAAHSDEDYEFGMGVVTKRQRDLLRLLHEECGGWWVWEDGAVFIRADEWESRRPAQSPSDQSPKSGGAS